MPWDWTWPIAAWGLDLKGEVSNTPTGAGFKAIAGGVWFSMAVRADGTIVSWGCDDDGQISGTPEGNFFFAISSSSSDNNYFVAIRAPQQRLLGDLNFDGTCGITDLNMVLIHWGKSGPVISDIRADVNWDGTVNIIDLNAVLTDWGKSQ